MKVKASIHDLYALKNTEGSLTWEECNGVNADLCRINSDMIPTTQIENVFEYLGAVLFWESSLLIHRRSLFNLYTSMEERLYRIARR
ncbi:MAG: hypothetical protein COB58_02005 [Thalassobium sp.]|nr:MAG: hypothetical protein COB58_14155 [Thalassobium sp.]PHQ87973.1 MAG: hypothetical protein COB58_02005 [Thalassobium sp.]